jgi:hypothetical protein
MALCTRLGMPAVVDVAVAVVVAIVVVVDVLGNAPPVVVVRRQSLDSEVTRLRKENKSLQGIIHRYNAALTIYQTKYPSSTNANVEERVEDENVPPLNNTDPDRVQQRSSNATAAAFFCYVLPCLLPRIEKKSNAGLLDAHH